MQQKSLLILTGVTVVALAVAGLSTRDTGSSSDDDTGNLLLAGLADRINEVAEIYVENAGGSLTLRKAGEDWRLQERGGYPVDFGRVQETVVGLARMEIEEPKTALSANHSKLGIANPEDGDPVATRVRLSDGTGAEIAAVILGSSKPRPGSPGLFARLDGEDQVYLCSGQLEFDTVPTDWVVTEIISLESDRVETIDILHQDGEVLQLERSSEEETRFDVLDVPEGRMLQSPTIANGVGSVLSRLSLDEVRPASEVDFNDDPIATAYFRCYDGLRIEVALVSFEDGVWAHIGATFEEPEVVGPMPPADGEEAPSEDELFRGQADPEVMRAEVADLERRLDDWAFALPEYKVKILARRMEDLLKEVETVEELDPLAPGETAGEEGAMSLEELMRDAGPVLEDAEPETDDAPAAESDDASEGGNDAALDSGTDSADEDGDPGRS